MMTVSNVNLAGTTELLRSVLQYGVLTAIMIHDRDNQHSPHAARSDKGFDEGQAGTEHRTSQWNASA
jgi:hypothetical protein